MAGRWQWIDGEETYGPISKDELIAQIRKGRVTPVTQVRNSPKSPWRPCEDVPGLLQSAFARETDKDRSKKRGTDDPAGFPRPLVLGLIVLACVLGSALVATTITLVVHKAAEWELAPAPDEVVVEAEEEEPQNRIVDELQNPGMFPEEADDAEPARMVIVEPFGPFAGADVPVAAADGEPGRVEIVPLPIKADDVPDVPKPDPPLILPPIPEEKLSIAEADFDEFEKSVAFERRAGDALARYEVFAQSHEFTEQQRQAVDAEVAKWSERAAAGLRRLGDDWVSTEEVEQAETAAVDLIDRAEELIEQRSFRECIDLLKKASRADPNGIKADYVLGLIHLLPVTGVNKPKTAVRHFEEVLRRDPDHAGALNSLAVAQIKAGNFGGALDNLKQSAALMETCPEVGQNVGRVVALADAGRNSLSDDLLSAYRTLRSKLVGEGRAREFRSKTGWLHIVPVFPCDRKRIRPMQTAARRPSLVPYRSATGFVIAPGYLLTTRRFVLDQSFGLGVADAIGIADPGVPDSKLLGSVLAICDTADLALLSLPKLNAPPLSLSKEVPQVEAAVEILGFPRSGEDAGLLTRTRTDVTSAPDPAKLSRGSTYCSLNVRDDAGLWGAPVMDVDGSGGVVGVVVSSLAGMNPGAVVRTRSVTSAAVIAFVEEHIDDFSAVEMEESAAVNVNTAARSSVHKLTAYYETGVPPLQGAVKARERGYWVYEDRTDPP